MDLLYDEVKELTLIFSVSLVCLDNLFDVRNVVKQLLAQLIIPSYSPYNIPDTIPQSSVLCAGFRSLVPETSCARMTGTKVIKYMSKEV